MKKKENKNNKKSLTGILFEIDKPNSNGIVISKEVAKKMVEDFNDRINNGEIIHGNGYIEGEDDFFEKVGNNNFSDVSHLNKKLKIENNKIHANLELLATPKGKKIKEILELETKHFGKQEFSIGARYIYDKLLSFDIIKNFPTSVKLETQKKLI